MRSNQRNRAGLGLAHRFEQDADQRDVRDAFLGMTEHLKRRPVANATPFHEAGGARQTPGWALIRSARACLDAADEKGGLAPRATATKVAAYFDTLKAIALRGYEQADVSAELAIVEFACEASEAHVAVTRFAVERSPSSAATATKEVREAVYAGERVLSLTNRLALPAHPLPMGACR